MIKNVVVGTPTGQRAVKWVYCPECLRVWAFRRDFCQVCEDQFAEEGIIRRIGLVQGEGPRRKI